MVRPFPICEYLSIFGLFLTHRSDPEYDKDTSLVYFNAYDPADHKSG